MAPTKKRDANEIRKLIDLDKETIKAIAIDAVDMELAGFKPYAERILKETAAKMTLKQEMHITSI
jgi:hypothetical protein